MKKINELLNNICHRLTKFSRFFVACKGLNMVFYKAIRARLPSSNFERFYYDFTTFHGPDKSQKATKSKV